ncbi:J domain-containing protein [Mycena kentingensis (nom. inval.)]|nr:J domain-containing protein [Mycena kentingensis (nom. inval.)]
MLTCFLPLLLAPSCVSAVTQVPLSVDSDAYKWDIDRPPHPNATGHLIFDTISSLLQHWPNTKNYNGHSIVPGAIPAGTLLYHGRTDPEPPSGREWLALDPEFARIFCSREPIDEDPLPECWFLTLVTTRPVRVLYFDGTSAAKIPDGTIDAQDILSWGKVWPERSSFAWDYLRMNKLCDWAGVRNYSVRLYEQGTVSFSQLRAERLDPHRANSFLHASEWHDAFPGELRIKLDLSQLVSLYDTDLAPSLVEQRFNVSRAEHRLLGINQEDIDRVLARLGAIQDTPPSSKSGIDWLSLFQVIRDRYAKRLQVLQSTLKDASGSRAFHLVSTMLAPYTLDSAAPGNPGEDDNSWVLPIFKLCATTHTSFAATRVAFSTPSERLLLNAVQETLHEICRTLVMIYAEGEGGSVGKWKAEVDRLNNWLDWSEWLRCEPACSWDETCFLFGPPFAKKYWNLTAPRCIRAFPPYTFDAFE